MLRGSDVTNYLGFLGVTKPETTASEARRADGLAAHDAALDRLPDVARPPGPRHRLRALELPTTSRTWPRRGGSSRTSRRRRTRRSRTRGASRTSGSQLLADLGVVGFALGVATFATGLVIALQRAWRGSLRRRSSRRGFILVAAGTLNAIGIVAGIPLDAVTWLGLGLAAVAASLAAGARAASV